MKMNNRMDLHRDLFSDKLISQAIEDYALLVDITVEHRGNDDYARLLFDNPKYELALTMAEFRNYLIGLVRQDEY